MAHLHWKERQGSARRRHSKAIGRILLGNLGHAVLTLSRRHRESALSHGAFSLRARATMSSLPGRSFGVAKPPRRPRSLTLRAGKKSYQLALDVSSRRAADRSPTEQDGRRAESIGINSNMIRDNTQAVGTTPGRLIWLGCHGLTVGVAKRPDCLQENGQCGRPVGRTRVV